ncbi:MAG: 3'-5' exonuclease, partial [Halobacteriaceae archaeon]
TDQRMWTDRLTQYVRAVETLEAEEPLDGRQAQRLADILQSSAFGTADRSDLRDLVDGREEAADVDDVAKVTVGPDEIRDVVPFVPGPNAAADMLRKVTRFQRKSVDAYFRGDYQGMDPDRVRVGTIHSAKGREADHVFLATDLTEKVVEQMQATEPNVFEDADRRVPVLTDNERRVFYVGMSRARERLVLLENLVDGAPTLSIDVLLYNQPEGAVLEEVLDADDPITVQ